VLRFAAVRTRPRIGYLSGVKAYVQAPKRSAVFQAQLTDFLYWSLGRFSGVSASLAFESPAALTPQPDEAVVWLGGALALDCPAVDVDLLNLLLVSGLVLGTPPLDFSLW